MSAHKYVGLDVHKATTVVVVLDAEGGVLQQTTLRTSAGALGEFFSGLKGCVHVALEEGVHAAWLSDLLSPRVARVLVANPRELPSRARRNKNDRNDALLLARRLRSGDLKAVYHGDHGTRTLRQLARHYQTLVDDCTSVMNRIKAAYRGLGIDCPGTGVYSPDRRQLWLEKLENQGARFRVSALLEQLDALRELRKKAQAEMVREAKGHSAFRLLTTVPGFGPVRAAQLIALVETPLRFPTKRNLWAYAGLAVVQYESDEYRIEGDQVRRARERVRTRGLNKNGNRRLKYLLKSAAASACWKEPMKGWYERRLAGGLGKELAQVDLARKLGAIALAVWKRGEAFEEERIASTTT